MEMCPRGPYSRGGLEFFHVSLWGSKDFSPTIRAGGPRVFPQSVGGGTIFMGVGVLLRRKIRNLLIAI